MMAVAILAISCNGNKYTITANIEGVVGEVTLSNPVDQSVIASTEASADGSFSFSGTVEKAQLVMLMAPEAGMSSIIILEPGKIDISIDYEKGFRVMGTPLNEELTNLSYELTMMSSNPEVTQEQIIETLVSATRENKDNPLAVFWFMNVYTAMPSADAEALYAELSEENQQDPSLLEAMEYILQTKRTDVGQPYIPITMLDAKGSEVALADVVAKNKYTLIDFWASWCNPCMAEVPYLIEAYNDYSKKGFEIYAISLDRDAEQWVSAYEYNKMGWIHVSPLAGGESTATEDYAIMTIPANFLIDQQGTIVAKNLRGEELVAKLAELMK